MLMKICYFGLEGFAMHRVGSAGNTAGSTRPRKEKRLTYVLNYANDEKVKPHSPNVIMSVLIFWHCNIS